jgi:calcineurin-like phosphoesterase family protein
MSIFFTADTHFGHNNIIKYCNRPFKNSDEMDEVLIFNWNNIVNHSDTVYHLGDFALRNPNEYIKKLKGNVILIPGNHDKHETITLFKHVYHLTTIKIENKFITLCHFALRVWNKSHFNAWHLYGHSHGTLESIGKSHDVGVDNCNYAPVSFEKIKEIMETKPDNFNWLERFKEFDVNEFNEVKKLVDAGVEVD